MFLVFIFISGFWGQENVEENIDLLGMAPEDEPSVITMKEYSKDFNAGQVGMILIEGDISGTLLNMKPNQLKNCSVYLRSKII